MPSHIDRDDIASRWRERGFSCGLWVDPPGQVWADFVHDVDELVLLIQGEVEVEIDGVMHHPAPGEELLIPARTSHTVRNVGHSESHWLYGYKSR